MKITSYQERIYNATLFPLILVNFLKKNIILSPKFAIDLPKLHKKHNLGAKYGGNRAWARYQVSPAVYV